jgi:predicted MFS family arabinose efflux permease
MSTLYIALEIGIGLGALYSGWAYGNNPANFAKTFWSGAMLALVAVIILIRFRHQKLPHVSRTNENH